MILEEGRSGQVLWVKGHAGMRKQMPQRKGRGESIVVTIHLHGVSKLRI
jgi:hypothetical protein